MQILEINPEPMIISDTTSHFLAVFGGITPLIPTNKVSTNASAVAELQHELIDFTDELTPVLDDAYRIELSSYGTNEKLETDIEPFKKKLRYATSTSDWRLDPATVHTFQTLRNIILGQFLDGRHTAFGLTPTTKQLYYTHILQKDSRKIHEFVGLLQMKIFELFALKGKIHYMSELNTVNITILLDALKQKPTFQGDDKLIYF